MEEEKIRNYILRLLKYRPRSRKEIEERLKKKKIESTLIERILNDLTKLGLIDDRGFVKFWINWRKEINPRSKKFIFWELRKKGIPEELIKEELDKFSCGEELSLAEEIASKRFQRLKNIEPEKAKRRIFGYLQRRGFSQDTILEVIDKLFK